MIQPVDFGGFWPQRGGIAPRRVADPTSPQKRRRSEAEVIRHMNADELRSYADTAQRAYRERPASARLSARADWREHNCKIQTGKATSKPAHLQGGTGPMPAAGESC